MATRPSISAIIITLNEETTLERLLTDTTIREADEIIVADGGSTDRTQEIARRHARLVIHSPSRAMQMNAGAREACGEILLFLHSDVHLESGAIEAVRQAMCDEEYVGGNLDIRFEGGDWISATFKNNDSFDVVRTDRAIDEALVFRRALDLIHSLHVILPAPRDASGWPKDARN